MDLLPMLIVIVIVIISNVYSYENITLFNIYAFYLVYCVWLHWETEVLEALTEFLMLLPAILHPCWFCFKHLNSINLIHDYNLMLSPLGLPAYHWTWRLSWGPLRPVINHWPSGIEGFLARNIQRNFHESITTLTEWTKSTKKCWFLGRSSCTLAIAWSCRFSAFTLLLM